MLIAHALRDEFEDGVFLVELASLTTADALLKATAQALGLREEVDRSLLRTICDSLSQRHILLVLDNIERLIDGCIALIWEILRTCPHVKILTSGREALRLREETMWRVPPMPVPPLSDSHFSANAGLGDLLGFEAVELFFQRARSGGGYFEMTGESARKVANICCQLEGIPLAHQRLNDRAIENARSILGDTTFTVAYDQGKMLSLEQAVTLSLTVSR